MRNRDRARRACWTGLVFIVLAGCDGGGERARGSGPDAAGADGGPARREVGPPIDDAGDRDTGGPTGDGPSDVEASDADPPHPRDTDPQATDGGLGDAGPDATRPDALVPTDAAPRPRDCAQIDASRPVPADLPLIFYYGFFQAPGGGIDEALNARLVQPGLDVAFGVANPLFEPAGGYEDCPPMTPTFQRWRALGATLAKRVTEDELAVWLRDGSALPRFEQLFRYGWDYVHVDELSGEVWGDAGELGLRLRDLLIALGAAGRGRRVILWFSPGTTAVWQRPAPPGESQGGLDRYRTLFRTCQNQCRRMIFEAYPSHSEQVQRDRRLVTSTVVGPEDAAQYLERLAIRLSRVAEGTNTVSIAGIGLANEPENGLGFLDLPRCDLAPARGDCPQSPGNGGLRRQFAEMHQRVSHNWRGVAFYTPARVHDTAVYTVADVVEHVRGLTAWWIGR